MNLPDPVGPESTGDQISSRARSAVARLAWDEAFDGFAAADGISPLDADDLELWATAGYLLGHVDTTVLAYQRAFQLYADRGEARRAVRCGFWAGFILLSRGDMGQASGWLATAGRLLDEVPEECAEHGYMQIPDAFRQVAMEGDYEAGAAAAARIADIGRRCGDPDLAAFALNLQGRGLIRLGQTEEGLTLLDEAMVAVVSGELTAHVAGHVYCSLIEACEEIAEMQRAQEWTDALQEWCDRQQGMITFNGTCRVHRVNILSRRGQWPAALEEAERACGWFTGAADEAVTGLALYRMAEVHRVMGDTAAAEEAYRQASEWGHEPQPGLALLRLTQGRVEVAAAALERLLGESQDPVTRLALLGAYVAVMLAAKEVTKAGQAASELALIASVHGTPALGAQADHAQGAVALASGDAATALGSLRRAHTAWRELDAPYEAARVRVLIGEACRALGDEDTADMELAAARKSFVELGAAPELARLDELTTTSPDPGHGLSPREVEVLRLVATGKTNQAIADELYLAVKTVDRHVGNILTKLAVPSRTAATAFAYERGIV